MGRRIESHLLEGPAGRLEALLEEPEERAPVAAAVLCHPHPLYGGTMHNKVVYRLARGLRRSGIVVLRFNFRGVNRSEGVHDHGVGEVQDAAAALDWVRGRYPDLPCTLAGFSFGSRVILALGALRADVKRLIAVGFPAALGETGLLGQCATDKVYIQSTEDEYGPQQAMINYYNRVSDPKQLIWIPASDHFFGGALQELEDRVAGLGMV
jgi:alpha/beta superfamily hydrolase